MWVADDDDDDDDENTFCLSSCTAVMHTHTHTHLVFANPDIRYPDLSIYFIVNNERGPIICTLALKSMSGIGTHKH